MILLSKNKLNTQTKVKKAALGGKPYFFCGMVMIITKNAPFENFITVKVVICQFPTLANHTIVFPLDLSLVICPRQSQAVKLYLINQTIHLLTTYLVFQLPLSSTYCLFDSSVIYFAKYLCLIRQLFLSSTHFFPISLPFLFSSSFALEFV